MRFRFVDRVVSFEKGERSKIVTAKSFPRSDEFLEGYPQRPGEVPTCLVMETLATSAVRLVYSHTDERVVGVLLRVRKIEIPSRVQAGEEILVHTELLGFQPQAEVSVGLAQIQGRALVGERVVAEAHLVLLCFPRDGLEDSLPW
jgi:3-hydroxymyristoyl/3-hydroxydecanoyl-(acyl carrier protein) dehydratase